MTLLHESLTELAELAPQCSDTPTVRGVLAESQDLVRNAIDHGERPQALVEWFSRLVSDVLHSEAIADMTGGAQLVLTGAIGRGDALPFSPIKWLTVGESHVDTTPVSDLITSVGLVAEHTRLGPTARTKQEWLSMIGTAQGSELAVFADAGTWCLEEVVALPDHKPLLTDAIEHRPPTLRTHDGLPSRDMSVDIRKDLLYPIIAIARWAGVAAHSRDFSTRRRIPAAVAAGILTTSQADFLRQAWDAGLQLQFRRWTDRVHSHAATAESLPAIQRSIYGASSRLVSDVIRALAQQYDIPLKS
ncbi:nucleotidyltransferase [Corynebacterium belfantii]|uniref:putative nucleotidyltransferase substrate binding domain-containing protein n=1 Tax=Corynebacterium belfantii TaxID=2014537 RepID=UPI0018D2A12A|nr:putative nucleotidyltransferase substrate binding domain-containing protein [Corynebacterium belfantii]MBG9319344.1 nucleotidyltransferase [Corynebacterium belfantii]